MVLEVLVALKQDVNSALTCLCGTAPLVVHGDSKEMRANVHFCSLVLPRRYQTLFCGLFCGVLILLNTLIKGRGLHQSLQVHCVPLLGTVCKSQVHFGTDIGSWDLLWKLQK